MTSADRRLHGKQHRGASLWQFCDLRCWANNAIRHLFISIPQTASPASCANITSKPRRMRMNGTRSGGDSVCSGRVMDDVAACPLPLFCWGCSERKHLAGRRREIAVGMDGCCCYCCCCCCGCSTSPLPRLPLRQSRWRQSVICCTAAALSRGQRRRARARTHARRSK